MSEQEPVIVSKSCQTAHGSFALFVFFVPFLVAPFFLFNTIPLYDLPDHIARQHILFDDDALGASRYYEAHWRLVPNLAMEGMVFLLHRFVSVDTAIRIFLAVSVVQVFLGSMVLNRSLFGVSNCLPLAAALFAYSGPFIFGFVNCYFGIGWVLWVFALWLRWRKYPASILIFGVLGSLALLAHLFAFGVYVVAVASYWANTALRQFRRKTSSFYSLASLLAEICHLAIPIAIFFAFMPLQYGAAAFDYVDFRTKLNTFSSILGFNQPAWDLLFLLIIAGGIVMISSLVILARDMWMTLCSLAIAFVVLPHRFGEGTFVDTRMLFTLVMFLIGSTGWRDPVDRWTRAYTFFVSGLASARISFVYLQWASWQPIYSEYVTAFELLPQEARLLPITNPSGVINLYDHPPLGHVAAFAVMKRDALIPTLFSGNDHQVLDYKPFYKPPNSLPKDVKSPARFDFDYILVVHPERFDSSDLPPFVAIARGTTFVLGKLK